MSWKHTSVVTLQESFALRRRFEPLATEQQIACVLSLIVAPLGSQPITLRDYLVAEELHDFV